MARLDERREVRVAVIGVFDEDALVLHADDDDAIAVVFGEEGDDEVEG